MSESTSGVSRTGISISCSWTLLGYASMLITAICVGALYRDFYIVTTLAFVFLNFLAAFAAKDDEKHGTSYLFQNTAWFLRVAKCLAVVAFYLAVLLILKPYSPFQWPH